MASAKVFLTPAQCTVSGLYWLSNLLNIFTMNAVIFTQDFKVILTGKIDIKPTDGIS